MQRIGLIGAPGAGKTNLAYALKDRFKEAGTNVVGVIDDYVEEAERNSFLALGFYATYIGNLYVALHRFAREHNAELGSPDYIITCGTLIENQLYAAVEGANTERYADVPEEHQKRTVVSMQALGLFMQDLFLYDKLFYLPYEEEHEGYLKTFDENIPLTLELWGVEATRLTGTLDEKVEAAFASITQVPSADSPASQG